MDDERRAAVSQPVDRVDEEADVSGGVLIAADHRARHRVDDEQARRLGQGAKRLTHAADLRAVEQADRFGQEARPREVGMPACGRPCGDAGL
jgi:hypothetical protein